MKDNKRVKRFTAFILVWVLVLGTFLGTGASVRTAEAAKKSKLNKKNVTVLVGKAQKLKLLQKQKGAKYVWKSSNRKVVKVNAKGKVTGVKKGSANVVCNVTGKGKAYKLKCKVKVVKGAKKVVVYDEMDQKVTSLSLIKGEQVGLVSRISPASSNDEVKWKSSNKKVASVDKWGYVTGLKNGKTNVTATALSGKKATVKVSVEEITISSYLKDAYADYFSIGVAANLSQLQNPTDMDHIMKNYNSLTLENEMKPEALLGWQAELVDRSQAEFAVPESYQEAKVPKLNYEKVDAVLEIAKSKGLKMRGHTLVWHSQTPSWFFREGFTSSGSLVSKEVMNARMEYYIQQILTHVKEKYPDVIYAWDVVNEAFENDGGALYKDGLRKMSNWYSIYKDDSYIVNAFRYARKYQEAGASLFYNDYNEYIVNKTDNICELAAKLKTEELIDGIGMQAHLGISFPDVPMIGRAIDKFSALGLQVQLTELDITIGSTGLYRKQSEMYKELFTMLLNKKKAGANITNVTFWGLNDEVSWRGGKGNPNQYPLLFMDGYHPKPAAAGVLAAVGK